MALRGTVHGIQVAPEGGVPKRGVRAAAVAPDGIAGDRQRHPRAHGGPLRAVCLLGLDVIERLAAAGHPIHPGAAGENLTLAGIDWSRLGVGTHFSFEGGVALETVSFAAPCGTIRQAFADGDPSRLDAARHPGQARHYCRVLTPGRIRVGEEVVARTVSAAGGSA